MIKRFEPKHDKTNKRPVHPAKTYISLGIHPVWSESSLCTLWATKDPIFLHADSEDSDQTGQMPRLIWVLTGRTGHFVGYFMLWLIFIIWCRSMSTVSFMDEPGHDDSYRPRTRVENTYQMEPKKCFPYGTVKNIIRDVLEGYLAEERYEPELCRQMSKTITEVWFTFFVSSTMNKSWSDWFMFGLEQHH